jgi:hypothetical protein
VNADNIFIFFVGMALVSLVAWGGYVVVTESAHNREVNDEIRAICKETGGRLHVDRFGSGRLRLSCEPACECDGARYSETVRSSGP